MLVCLRWVERQAPAGASWVDSEHAATATAAEATAVAVAAVVAAPVACAAVARRAVPGLAAAVAREARANRQAERAGEEAPVEKTRRL